MMLDFEHSLFMLLLLVGLFSARSKHPWLSTIILLCGILLLLIAPQRTWFIPWNGVLAAVIPILFWQNHRFWMQAKRPATWQEILLWLGTVLLITLSMVFIVRVTWLGALLFGIIATSLLWRFIEPQAQTRWISQAGILVLIFLLTEISLIVETPKRYVGSLFSGAAIGLAVALASLYLAERTSLKPHGWLAVLQVYAAYLLAGATNSSGVVAALVSVVAYNEGAPKDSKAQLQQLAPLNHWGVYLPFLLLFWLLGWQMHIPFSLSFVIEGMAGLLLGMLISWMVHKTNRQTRYSAWESLSNGVQLGAFLFVCLTLWPKHLMQDPLPFLIALGLAAFALLLSAALLRAIQEV